MSEFAYDVAFSFHQADEGLAQQLNDLLQDRFRTFIYSEQQKVLAGRDGEDAFASVYAQEARVVVVFSRAAWGETPFTRIEKTAIRGRAYENGYDFTLFIPTEDPPSVPNWLPRTQLWFGLARFGMDGAAAVIEQKIQTLGGEVSIESVANRAARFDRATQLRKIQEQFLDSEIGVQAAAVGFSEVKAALIDRAERIHEATPNVLIKTHEIRDMLVMTGLRTVLIVSWSTRYLNVLKGHPLTAAYLSGVPRLPGYMPPMEEPRTLGSEKYQFELTGEDRTGYVDVSNANRTFTPAELADHLLMRYIDMSEKHGRRD